MVRYFICLCSQLVLALAAVDASADATLSTGLVRISPDSAGLPFDGEDFTAALRLRGIRLRSVLTVRLTGGHARGTDAELVVLEYCGRTRSLALDDSRGGAAARRVVVLARDLLTHTRCDSYEVTQLGAAFVSAFTGLGPMVRSLHTFMATLDANTPLRVDASLPNTTDPNAVYLTAAARANLDDRGLAALASYRTADLLVTAGVGITRRTLGEAQIQNLPITASVGRSFDIGRHQIYGSLNALVSPLRIRVSDMDDTLTSARTQIAAGVGLGLLFRVRDALWLHSLLEANVFAKRYRFQLRGDPVYYSSRAQVMLTVGIALRRGLR